MENIALADRPLHRRMLLHGLAVAAAASLLAACGKEPNGPAGASNPTPTPAPTRIIVTPTPPPTPTPLPPGSVRLVLTIDDAHGPQDFNRPGSLALDAQGNLYVTELGSQRVDVFDPSGTLLRMWGTQGDGDGQFIFRRVNPPPGVPDHNPDFGTGSTVSDSSIAVGPQGRVYVGDSTSRVQMFDPTGRFLGRWGGAGAGNGQFALIEGMAFDNRGVLHVADAYNYRIQMFDPGGTFLGTWGKRGKGDGEFDSPREIAVDGQGNIFVVDRNNDRVQKFDRKRNFVLAWGRTGIRPGEFNRPRGVCVDARGDVYVADNGNNRVQKFSNNGGFLTRWGEPQTSFSGMSLPFSIRVDAQGYVWVADADNSRILKFQQL